MIVSHRLSELRLQDPEEARTAPSLVSTDEYYLTPPPGNEFIFGFSALSERAIREGIRRLAR